jgi:hypothetical protein
LEKSDAADEDFIPDNATGENLRRILERKTRKVLPRRLKRETPMQLILLLT